MKKIKKFVALALATVMMMAMSVTAFATEATNTATITVNNADNATLTYAQVIVADTTTTTGWKIVDEYVSAFQQLPDMSNVTDTQALIKAYIRASESDRATALANISTSETFTNGMEVSKAGLYVINATETGYTYKTMAAYIGFDYEDGTATSLKNATLNAKKEATTVAKEANESYVEVGETVTYTVTSTVPYIPAGQTLETAYAISDTITGATYDVDDNNQLTLNVTVGAANAVAYKADVTTNEDGTQSFTLDLSDLIDDDNSNANLSVTITYTATATSLTISNKAYPIVADHDYSDNYTTVNTYSGQITITKYDEGTNVLSGAEFVIKNSDGEFATLDNNYLTGWVDSVDDASTITTGTDGTATAYGFDAEKTYSFVEVTAPTGYSLSSDSVDVDWDETPETATVRYGSATLTDSKLEPLPFTGGMGTTIFTVLGVAIMAIAAALYFATKRKATK